MNEKKVTFDIKIWRIEERKKVVLLRFFYKICVRSLSFSKALKKGQNPLFKLQILAFTLSQLFLSTKKNYVIIKPIKSFRFSVYSLIQLFLGSEKTLKESDIFFLGLKFHIQGLVRILMSTKTKLCDHKLFPSLQLPVVSLIQIFISSKKIRKV